MKTKPRSEPVVGLSPRETEVVAKFREAEKAPTVVRGQSQWYRSWRTFRQNRLAVFCLVGFIVLVMVAILAPWLAPYDPLEMDDYHTLEGPTKAHLWGTDNLGRDILSRVLWGGRASLRTSMLAVLVALGGGVFFGLISGYIGGYLDELIQRIVEILLALPTILLIILIVTILGPGLVTVLLALGLASIPAYTRLVRGSVLEAKNKEYVVAAKAVGAPEWRIMYRHILPNIIAPIIIYSTLYLGSAIRVTAGLSYIGLGAQPPSPEWGAMLNYGRKYIYDAWWMSVFPGAAIFLTVLWVNMVGDGLRDALDPKLRV